MSIIFRHLSIRKEKDGKDYDTTTRPFSTLSPFTAYSVPTLAEIDLAAISVACHCVKVWVWKSVFLDTLIYQSINLVECSLHGPLLTEPDQADDSFSGFDNGFLYSMIAAYHVHARYGASDLADCAQIRCIRIPDLNTTERTVGRCKVSSSSLALSYVRCRDYASWAGLEDMKA